MNTTQNDRQKEFLAEWTFTTEELLRIFEHCDLGTKYVLQIFGTEESLNETLNVDKAAGEKTIYDFLSEIQYTIEGRTLQDHENDLDILRVIHPIEFIFLDRSVRFYFATADYIQAQLSKSDEVETYQVDGNVVRTTGSTHEKVGIEHLDFRSGFLKGLSEFERCLGGARNSRQRFLCKLALCVLLLEHLVGIAAQVIPFAPKK